MKNLFSSKLSLLALGLVIIFSSCTPEDPVGGEEEITTVNLIFSSGQTVTWKEGSATPEITLDANTTYTVTAEFLNEEDPANVEDITIEIKEEDDEHLVCYDVLGSANLTVTRTDTDGAYEVGIDTEWVTGEASTGTLALALRHQPDVKDGTCEPGDSDVEIDFNIVIN